MIKSIYFIGILLLCFSCNSKAKKRSSYSAEHVTITNDPQDQLKESMERGGLVYTDFCMQCHMANGQGVPGTFPPLMNSNWLQNKRTKSIHAVKYGQKGEITVNGETYNGVMVPMGLTDQEIADVMNYIMNRWGNTQHSMVTEEEVANISK